MIETERRATARFCIVLALSFAGSLLGMAVAIGPCAAARPIAYCPAML